MTKGFLGKNWIYVALFFLIVILNVLPRLGKEQKPKEEVKISEKTPLSEKEKSLFVDFQEAQKRGKQIEESLKLDIPLYVFYLSANLAILFIFLLGLLIDGYFIYKSSRKETIFLKTADLSPPDWGISEVFKIVVLTLTFGYVFFIGLGFFVSAIEAVSKTKFTLFDNENFRMIFDTIILDGIILAVILNFLWRVHKKRIVSLGLATRNMARNIFYGALGYVGIIPLIFTIGILIYILLNIFKLSPPPQPIVGLFLVEKNVMLMLISSVIASVFGPIIEEIFFRGVMYNAVKKKIGVFRAILVTSLLFSFLHTHAMTYFLVGFIPIAILGALLAYLYEKTGSLIPSITLHILNNVGSVSMVFAFRYFNSLAA